MPDVKALLAKLNEQPIYGHVMKLTGEPRVEWLACQCLRAGPHFLVDAPHGPWGAHIDTVMDAVRDHRHVEAGMVLYQCAPWIWGWHQRPMKPSIDHLRSVCNTHAANMDRPVPYSTEVECVSYLWAFDSAGGCLDAQLGSLLALTCLTMIEAQHYTELVRSNNVAGAGSPALWAFLAATCRQACTLAGTPHNTLAGNVREYAVIACDRAVGLYNTKA
jgi:hypothetical protein